VNEEYDADEHFMNLFGMERQAGNDGRGRYSTIFTSTGRFILIFGINMGKYTFGICTEFTTHLIGGRFLLFSLHCNRF
jgi:hypothetical protein